MSHVSAVVFACLAMGCVSTDSYEDTAPARLTGPELAPSQVLVRVTETEKVILDTRTQSCIGPQPRGADVPDGPLRAIRVNGQIRAWSPHFPGNFPLVGASFDSLTHDCSPVLSSGFDANPEMYDDAEWLWAVRIRPDGVTVDGLIHDEFHGAAHREVCRSGDYGRCWRNGVTLATSTDGGRTFNHAPPPAHVVARVPVPFAEAPEGQTPGGYYEPTNLVLNRSDGLFYSLVRVTEHGGQPRGGLCVMRTSDPGDPGAYRVWNGASFDTPSATGAWCATVLDVGGHSAGNVTWNRYFNRFVLVEMYATLDAANRQGFAMRFSDDLVRWSEPVWLLDVPLPWGDYGSRRNAQGEGYSGYAYPSLIDPESTDANFDTTDDTVHLYYVRTPMTSSLDRRLLRIALRFEEGAPVANSAPGLFKVGDGVYASNGTHRCHFVSMRHFEAAIGTSSLDDVARWEAVPSTLIDDGACAGNPDVPPSGNPPRGFFRVEGSGYYSNGEGAYCGIWNMDQFVGCVGNDRFFDLPNYPGPGTLRDDGQCLCGRPASEPPAPAEPPTVFYPGEGFYRIGGSGYYSNGIGAYCSISTWDQYVGCTNNRPWSEIPEQPNHGNNEYQGVCLCGT